jgi:thiamine biosynthesis lipoprotein
MSAPIRRMRPLLGTFVTISCVNQEAAGAERALETAYSNVAVVDARMHPTRTGSDLVRIGETSPGCGVRVHPWTWEVLALSKRLHDLSGGVFDPCLARAGRLADVELPEPAVVVTRSRVVIDLGGIAKGFAVDCAIDALLQGGCSSGEVNAGGDLRAFGEPRSIWIRTCDGASPITLQDRACAVSDPSQQARPSEHRGYYRRAGRSDVGLTGGRAAVVLAPTAALADGLTKCVLLSTSADERVRLATTLATLQAESLVLGPVSR